MKVFRVVTERDGRVMRAPGLSETEVKREEWRYAAEDIRDVWKIIQPFFDDPDCLVIAVHEESPAITIISPTINKGDQA